jgi:hypothetical protein
MNVRPVTLRDAQSFVSRVHRHHCPPRGARAALGLFHGCELVGVATMGRPVARAIPNHTIAEVTRVAVQNDVRHGCSMLYGAAARMAQAWGFYAVMTYTLAEESGASLRAAGWWPEEASPGRSWNTPGRPRQGAKGDHRFLNMLGEEASVTTDPTTPFTIIASGPIEGAVINAPTLAAKVRENSTVENLREWFEAELRHRFPRENFRVGASSFLSPQVYAVRIEENSRSGVE